MKLQLSDEDLSFLVVPKSKGMTARKALQFAKMMAAFGMPFQGILAGALAPGAGGSAFFRVEDLLESGVSSTIPLNIYFSVAPLVTSDDDSGKVTPTGQLLGGRILARVFSQAKNHFNVASPLLEVAKQYRDSIVVRPGDPDPVSELELIVYSPAVEGAFTSAVIATITALGGFAELGGVD